MRHRRVLNIGLVLLATLAAFVVTTGWKILVARNAAGSLAGAMETPSILVVRGFYLFVQMIGVAIGGGIIAVLTFDTEKPFAHNVTRKITPMAAFLFLPSLLSKLLSENAYPLSYTATWIALAALSLIAGAWGGAWVGAWLKRRFGW